MLPPNVRHTTEFVYDENVYIVIEKGDGLICGVFDKYELADYFIKDKNIYRIAVWKVIRRATEIPRYARTVGQISKSN